MPRRTRGLASPVSDSIPSRVEPRRLEHSAEFGGDRTMSSDMTPATLAAAMPGAALVSGWDPGTSVLGILGLLCVACLLLMPFVLLAGYAIGRKRGVVITAIALLLPGIAGLTGFW